MPITTTHIWRAPNRRGVNNKSSASLAANLFLVPDGDTQTGALPDARVPATASTPVVLLGISEAAIPAGKTGSVASDSGDVVVGTASGNIALGNRLIVDTGATKEGRAKAAAFPAEASVLIAGTALEAAADGEQFYIRLAPKIRSVA